MRELYKPWTLNEWKQPTLYRTKKRYKKIINQFPDLSRPQKTEIIESLNRGDFQLVKLILKEITDEKNIDI